MSLKRSRDDSQNEEPHAKRPRKLSNVNSSFLTDSPRHNVTFVGPKCLSSSKNLSNLIKNTQTDVHSLEEDDSSKDNDNDNDWVEYPCIS